MGRRKSLQYVYNQDRKQEERKWESKWTGMEKHNCMWTEGSIDQVPEIEITWNWQSTIFHLRSLELLKVSLGVFDFLKQNMKMWQTQLTFAHDSGTLMSDNINMKREIFQGDSFCPHYSSAFHSYHSH